MRIWSLHPSYLDTKGLLAAWREGLLAKKVLEGKTKGYKNHPQLDRFKKSEQPLNNIHLYLKEIWLESKSRGYSFDKSKIEDFEQITKNRISVTSKQVKYEFELLKRKLKSRDNAKFKDVEKITKIEINELFFEINGKIENWEKTIPEIEALVNVNL